MGLKVELDIIVEYVKEGMFDPNIHIPCRLYDTHTPFIYKWQSYNLSINLFEYKGEAKFQSPFAKNIQYLKIHPSVKIFQKIFFRLIIEKSR